MALTAASGIAPATPSVPMAIRVTRFMALMARMAGLPIGTVIPAADGNTASPCNPIQLTLHNSLGRPRHQ